MTKFLKYLFSYLIILIEKKSKMREEKYVSAIPTYYDDIDNKDNSQREIINFINNELNIDTETLEILERKNIDFYQENRPVEVKGKSIVLPKNQFSSRFKHDTTPQQGNVRGNSKIRLTHSKNKECNINNSNKFEKENKDQLKNIFYKTASVREENNQNVQNKLIKKNIYSNIKKMDERLVLKDDVVFPVNEKKNHNQNFEKNIRSRSPFLEKVKNLHLQEDISNNLRINKLALSKSPIRSSQTKSTKSFINKNKEKNNNEDFFFEVFKNVAGQNKNLKLLTNKVSKVINKINFDFEFNDPVINRFDHHNKEDMFNRNKGNEMILDKIKEKEKEKENMNDSYMKYDLRNDKDKDLYVKSLKKNLQEFSAMKSERGKNRNDLFSGLNDKINQLYKKKQEENENVENNNNYYLNDKLIVSKEIVLEEIKKQDVINVFADPTDKYKRVKKVNSQAILNKSPIKADGAKL